MVYCRKALALKWIALDCGTVQCRRASSRVENANRKCYFKELLWLSTHLPNPIINHLNSLNSNDPQCFALKVQLDEGYNELYNLHKTNISVFFVIWSDENYAAVMERCNGNAIKRFTLSWLHVIHHVFFPFPALSLSSHRLSRYFAFMFFITHAWHPIIITLQWMIHGR